ncbi:metallophosphoesterase [Candidatus Woesearchaeota archaeon]|nr:metallophosphoesterase [Candidatus Woesearchaeota archaeon]
MEAFKGARIIGLTLFLEKEKVLVLGDVHVGYEEALNKQGVLIPRFQMKEIFSHLKKVFLEVKPRKIILLGDLKHEFGTISRQEWKDTLMLLDFLLKESEVILIRGNHDKILGPIAGKRGVEVKDSYSLGKYFFCHGDQLFSKDEDYKKAKIVIIGHEHPAISIRDGARVERYKCFLSGRYGLKKLVVLPSMNLVTEGTDVLAEKTLSPFIKDVDAFNVIAILDKAYDFGKIRSLKKLMRGH